MAAPVYDTGSLDTFSGTTQSPVLTISTSAAGAVVAIVTSNTVAPTGVAGATVGAFTKIAQGGSATSLITAWLVQSAGALTDEVITVTRDNTAFISVHVFGVTGTNVELDASSPDVTTGVGHCSLDTAVADALIIGAYRFGSTSSPTAGTGFTAIAGTGFMLTERLTASVTQSGLDIDIGTGDGNENGGLAFALIEADDGGGEGVSIAVPLDTLSVSGLVPTIAAGVNIASPLDAISVSGNVPTISTGVNVTAPLATISVTDFEPTVAAGGEGVAVTVPLAGISVTDQAPSVGTGSIVTVPVALISIAGLAPTVAAGKSVVVPLDEVSITGLVPGVSSGVSVAVPLNQLSITGKVPSLSASPGVNMAVPLDTISINAFEPAIQTTFTLLTNAQYEVYFLTRNSKWEHGRIVFTGNDFGVVQ